MKDSKKSDRVSNLASALSFIFLLKRSIYTVLYFCKKFGLRNPYDEHENLSDLNFEININSSVGTYTIHEQT